MDFEQVCGGFQGCRQSLRIGETLHCALVRGNLTIFKDVVY